MELGQIKLTPEEERVVNKFGRERFIRSINATNTYLRLMNSFAKNLNGTEYSYPQYYGGAYNDNDGVLVINVTEDIARCREDLALRIDDSQVKYQLVPFSFTFLKGISDSIQCYIDKGSNNIDEVAQNIKAWGIRQKLNRVVVYMENTSEEQIRKFKEKVTSSDAVQVVSMHGNIVDDTIVYAGNPLDYGSTAYRAKNSEHSVGVVTAAHCVSKYAYISTDGVPFARCTVRKHGGALDAAFCKITDTKFVPSNSIYGLDDAELSIYSVNVSEGTMVFKVGAKTGLTMGYVIDTYYSYTNNEGISFTNMSAASYQRGPGDSGGLVYYHTGSVRHAVGVHCAGYDEGAPENPEIRGIYCKAPMVNAGLDILRY